MSALSVAFPSLLRRLATCAGGRRLPRPNGAAFRDASTFGNVCPQLDSIFSGNFVGNEDCLVLNVYAAANLDPHAGQPVMVFFHGVVVVTAEYRLGALGFFAHPLLAIEGQGSSGNYALMDQIAALAWVQHNIRNFGGDPARVMAFGASSGAGAAHLTCWRVCALCRRSCWSPTSSRFPSISFSSRESCPRILLSSCNG